MMRRSLKKTSLFLAVLILVYQFIVPIGNVLAAESGTLLPPSNLVYSQSTPSDGKLQWSAVYGATGYVIYAIEEGQLIRLGTASTNSYSLTNLAEGTHQYVVSTLSSDGESGPCAPVSNTISYPKMQAPLNPASVIKNGNDIVLSWNAVQYAQNYNVYQLSETGEETLVKTVSAPSSTYTISNSPEGQFKYGVRAVNNLYGTSDLSALVDVNLVYPKMAKPGNPTFSITNGNDVTLSWQPASYASGYKVYQTVNGEDVLINTVTNTSVKLTNQPAGDYAYKVYSFSDRFGQSVDAGIINITVGAITLTPPSNLTSKIQNNNDIVLSWSAAANATGYKVYQVTDNGEELVKTQTGTTVTFTNMPAGDYTYKVYAYSDRFGTSQGSSVTASISQVIMAAPENAAYKLQNINDIVLTWSPAVNATGYKIYQVVDGEKVLKSTVSGTTVTYSNIPAGSYEYAVSSYSTKFGESETGSSVSVTIDPYIMGIPNSLAYKIQNGNDIILSWDAVPNTTNYKVYQIVNGQRVLKSSPTGASVTFTNMPAGEYKYEVTAFNTRFGESPEGAAVSTSLELPVMQPPSEVTQTIKNATDFSLSWKPADYAANYRVYQIVNGQKTLKSTVTGTSISYINMLPGTYNYEVTSYSSRFGESKGTSVEVNLNGQTMSAPTNLSYTISNGNDITFRWTGAQYASSYKVYQVVDGEKVWKATVTGTSAFLSNVSEGNLQFYVTSVSSLLGESPQGAETAVNMAYPVMAAPANLTKTITNGNDITLRWNTSAYAVNYKIYQVVNGEKILKKTVTGTSVSFTNMPEGDYQYIVTSYSDRFGESDDSNPLYFQLVFPTMQAPGNPAYSIANGNDIVLRWNASSYAAGYKIYQLTDGERKLVKTVTGTAYTFVNMPEGNYSYEITSYSDRFGESPIASAISFNLIWPTVPAPDLQGTVVNANNITLTWKAVNWANEYRVYRLNGGTRELLYKGTALTYKVYNLTEDTHSFIVTAYNTRFGESVSSNEMTETIVYPVMQAPNASAAVTGADSARLSWNFVAYANGYNIYEVKDGKTELIVKNVNNLSYSLQNLSYANHEYVITSYSNSFGESIPSNSVMAKLIVDTEAPVTTSNVSPNWTKEGQLVSLTGDDNETGVAHTYYSVNDGAFTEGTSVSVEKEGSTKLSFYSVDQAGNVEKTKTVYVKIDKTAPKTTSDAPQEWVNTNTLVALTASDENSGAEKTYFSLNGSEFKEGNEVTVEQEGINHISFYTVDGAGNKEEVQTAVVRIDKKAPLTRVSVPEGWVNKEAEINMTAEDEQSGVKATYYSINGSDYKEGNSLTISTQGVNKVDYYSVDSAGNKEESQSITIKMDTAAPSTELSAPKGWVQEAAVKLSAEDELSGVSKTYYSINGSDYKEGSSFTLNQEGINRIAYYSIDNAGNKEEVKSSEVKIDKTAPATTTSVPSGWVNEDVNVVLEASDEESGPAKTLYSVNGSEYMKGNTFTVQQEGMNTISYYSVDQAGNREDTHTIQVMLDKTAPVTGDNAPQSWVKDDTKIVLVPLDQASGTSKTYYSINGSGYSEGSSFTIEKEGINKVSYYSVDRAGNKEEVQTIEVKLDKSAPVIHTNLTEYYKLGSKMKLDFSSEDTLSGINEQKALILAPGEPSEKNVSNGSEIVWDKPGNYLVTIWATDLAGNVTTVKKLITVYIPASIEVTPKVIKGNKGIFTVRAELPAVIAGEFELNKTTLNNVKALNSNNGYYNQARNGQFKFERSDFNWAATNVTLELRSEVNGYLVIGTTTVTVQK
ncbi:OmpL47-type beta-barrel domain-containing protein [Peribacillus kribbensis]|uniref:OmpL47-type beta-barrel domain-containing protein n=1 Tax=Peribacillus kribbensis TaxID=356658 RepID=UPI0003F9EF0F|nr:fibronectin type III domain-containing protein [Peribacillus kribbensis]